MTEQLTGPGLPRCILCTVCDIDPYPWRKAQHQLLWLKKLGKKLFSFCKNICDILKGVMHGGKDCTSLSPMASTRYTGCTVIVQAVNLFSGTEVYFMIAACCTLHICSYHEYQYGKFYLLSLCYKG